MSKKHFKIKVSIYLILCLADVYGRRLIGTNSGDIFPDGITDVTIPQETMLLVIWNLKFKLQGELEGS